MIHPNTELQFISDEIGLGVVATAPIPAGTITWALDELDRVFTPDEIASFKPICLDIIDTYTFRDRNGNFILCWDNGKYVNHSFKSNCMTTAYDFEIAIRDIVPGEQLTDDYGYLNLTEPFEGIDEGTERKVAYPDDLVHYHKMWDKQLNNVFGLIAGLDQPLKQLISEKLWNTVVAVAGGKKEMESILENYYPDDDNKTRSTKTGYDQKKE
jgi:hypothetical protein